MASPLKGLKHFVHFLTFPVEYFGNMKVIILFCAVAAAFGFGEPEVQTCDERPDRGMCLAYFPMYYYDVETRTCKEFIYGGCQGNGNRYGTLEECLTHCSGVREDPSLSEICDLPSETGLCRGLFSRFYFNKASGKCEEFIYGGCGGNENNFASKEECDEQCSVTQAALDRPDCDKAPETGLCKAYMPRFYYDQEAGMCKKFIYGGCGGNRNNFKSEDECYNKCGALRAQPDACAQEKVVGPCRAAFPRFFFNKETGKCEKFIYGGCKGNDNNFISQEDCESTCVV